MSQRAKLVVPVSGRECSARTPFGARIVIHATAAEKGGSLGMWETSTPPGEGPAPHIHARESEVFRNIRGCDRFRCGEEGFEAAPGVVVTLPPFLAQSWRNVGDERGRMFANVTSRRCEQHFLDSDATGDRTPEGIAVIERRLGSVNAATETLGRGA